MPHKIVDWYVGLVVVNFFGQMLGNSLSFVHVYSFRMKQSSMPCFVVWFSHLDDSLKEYVNFLDGSLPKVGANP